MAKKIEKMNKAELIAYAESMDVKDIGRHLTIKQIMALITAPKKVKEGEKPSEPRLRPRKVRCAGCGRFIFNTETKECPDCHLHYCPACAAPGTCHKCGLYLDINLRKKKDDNQSKK